jgi:hypothetical protein
VRCSNKPGFTIGTDFARVAAQLARIASAKLTHPVHYDGDKAGFSLLCRAFRQISAHRFSRQSAILANRRGYG